MILVLMKVCFSIAKYQREFDSEPTTMVVNTETNNGNTNIPTDKYIDNIMADGRDNNFDHNGNKIA